MKDRGDGVRVTLPLFQEEDSGSIPTSPLQLTVIEISVQTARELNWHWHSILPSTHLGNFLRCRRSVCFGAEFRGIWFAVSMWTDPVAENRMKDGKLILELRRFAIAKDAPKNTASRMLGVMARLISRKWPELKKLISYQAVDVHKGTIYKAAGWIPTVKTKFRPWLERKDGKRNSAQTESDKVRWEKDL